jgi:hypothetical protein
MKIMFSTMPCMTSSPFSGFWFIYVSLGRDPGAFVGRSSIRKIKQRRNTTVFAESYTAFSIPIWT